MESTPGEPIAGHFTFKCNSVSKSMLIVNTIDFALIGEVTKLIRVSKSNISSFSTTRLPCATNRSLVDLKRKGIFPNFPES